MSRPFGPLRDGATAVGNSWPPEGLERRRRRRGKKWIIIIIIDKENREQTLRCVTQREQSQWLYHPEADEVKDEREPSWATEYDIVVAHDLFIGRNPPSLPSLSLSLSLSSTSKQSSWSSMENKHLSRPKRDAFSSSSSRDHGSLFFFSFLIFSFTI